MNASEIYAELAKIKSDEAAIHMAAYMKNNFRFLGVQAPRRKAVYKEFCKQARKGKFVDWALVNECWANEYREMQYVAVDYLTSVKNNLTPDDVAKLKKLAQTKSWWDTIDVLDRIIGQIALNYPQVNSTLLAWSASDDFWLRRIAIDHQLLRKDKTNKELLEAIIKNNFGQTEFFINKAIGWSLRDYSKTNPGWVKEFLLKYKQQMHALSIREASKYIT